MTHLTAPPQPIGRRPRVGPGVAGHWATLGCVISDLLVCFVGDSFVAVVGDPEHLGWVGRLSAWTEATGQRLTSYNLGLAA